jgi:hypothetical protein
VVSGAALTGPTALTGSTAPSGVTAPTVPIGPTAIGPTAPTGPTSTVRRTFSQRPGVGQKSRTGRMLAAVRQCSRSTPATPAIVSAGGRQNRRNRSEVLTGRSFTFFYVLSPN